LIRIAFRQAASPLIRSAKQEGAQVIQSLVGAGGYRYSLQRFGLRTNPTSLKREADGHEGRRIFRLVIHRTPLPLALTILEKHDRDKSGKDEKGGDQYQFGQRHPPMIAAD
jgi:hypothetical protein